MYNNIIDQGDHSFAPCYTSAATTRNESLTDLLSRIESLSSLGSPLNMFGSGDIDNKTLDCHNWDSVDSLDAVSFRNNVKTVDSSLSSDDAGSISTISTWNETQRRCSSLSLIGRSMVCTTDTVSSSADVLTTLVKGSSSGTTSSDCPVGPKQSVNNCRTSHSRLHQVEDGHGMDSDNDVYAPVAIKGQTLSPLLTNDDKEQGLSGNESLWEDVTEFQSILSSLLDDDEEEEEEPDTIIQSNAPSSSQRSDESSTSTHAAPSPSLSCPSRKRLCSMIRQATTATETTENVQMTKKDRLESSPSSVMLATSFRLFGPTQEEEEHNDDDDDDEEVLARTKQNCRPHKRPRCCVQYRKKQAKFQQPQQEEGAESEPLHSSKGSRQGPPIDFPVVNPTMEMMLRLNACLKKSTESGNALAEFDRQNGLPRSHCATMVNSSRSRKQLQCGLILPKWSGKPLLDIPGARAISLHKSRILLSETD